MKAIIDIIKAENKNGQHDIIIARYNKDIEVNLNTGIMDNELPEIGETLTDGNRDMMVIGHVVIDGSVGVKFENSPSIVAGSQIVKMLSDDTVRVK